MIFVSIASYRDPELIPTLRDMAAKAVYPDHLNVTVCWQHDEQAERPQNVGFRHLNIIPIPYQEAQGCCWARTQTQAHYDNERWYLQLDSHHRFTDGWDIELIGQAWVSGSPKPVLGSYAAPYELDQPLRPGFPIVMGLDRITPDRSVLFKGHARHDLEQRLTPVPARYVSGHFLFSLGSFVEDVPSDPIVYFTGEELALAVRAFTHGFDLFHPCQHILWHEYSRKARPKHWDDHHRWHIKDAISKDRVFSLLRGEIADKYGLGAARTVADYERYTGLDFTNWTATPDCYAANDPSL